MRIFDTHAHLLDEQFDGDRDALIASLRDAGIAHVMEACCDAARAYIRIRQANGRPKPAIISAGR